MLCMMIDVGDVIPISLATGVAACRNSYALYASLYSPVRLCEACMAPRQRQPLRRPLARKAVARRDDGEPIVHASQRGEDVAAGRRRGFLDGRPPHVVAVGDHVVEEDERACKG